jgi:hypothetical protein
MRVNVSGFERDDGLFAGLQVFQLDRAVGFLDFRNRAVCYAIS